MDIIFIEDFRVSASVGIYPRERAVAQPIEISLHIGASTAPAGQSDEIGDTIDYAVVVASIRASLESQHFNLLERLAEHIASLILHDFHAQWVKVSVAKLGMMPGVRRVGVTIERAI